MNTRTIIFLTFLGLLSCETSETRFGKQYNRIRVKYGSPILHDYLVLKSADEGFEHWRIPDEIHDTITTGFHAGKGFYIHNDSILQEDDIFRRRIDDSTFAFVAILTYGNLKNNEFSSIYYGSVDERELKLKASEYLNYKNHRQFARRELTIDEADSILAAWGTSRFK